MAMHDDAKVITFCPQYGQETEKALGWVNPHADRAWAAQGTNVQAERVQHKKIAIKIEKTINGFGRKFAGIGKRR